MLLREKNGRRKLHSCTGQDRKEGSMSGYSNKGNAFIRCAIPCTLSQEKTEWTSNHERMNDGSKSCNAHQAATSKVRQVRWFKTYTFSDKGDVDEPTVGCHIRHPHLKRARRTFTGDEPGRA